MKTGNILITTTQMIEGSTITKYMGIISARVVAGTNIFSDFFAELSDIFGGRSKTYNKQLQSIYNEVVQQLKEEARKVHANAVIGVHIDHDEISGKHKQMFMVTIIGTAVAVDYANAEMDGTTALTEISHELLEFELTKWNVIHKIKQSPLFLDGYLEFLTHNCVEEALDIVITQVENSYVPERLGPQVPVYIQAIGDYAKPRLYKRLYDTKCPGAIWKMITSAKLVDYELLNDYIKQAQFVEKKAALQYIFDAKSSYSIADIDHLENLKTTLNHTFTARGKILDDGRWECECGKVNSISNHYCKSCSKDIKGFNAKNTHPDEVIPFINQRQAVLRKILQVDVEIENGVV